MTHLEREDSQSNVSRNRAHGKSSLLLFVAPLLLLLSIAIGIKFCRHGHESDGLQQ